MNQAVWDRPEEVSQRSEIIEPIYHGSVQMLNWSETAKRGLVITLHLQDVPESEVHPFKGLGCGPQDGQRLVLVVQSYGAGDSGSLELVPLPIYQGESQLMRWADDYLNGVSVALRLDTAKDGTDGRNPFEAFAAGRREGDRFMATAWALSDTDEVLAANKAKKKRPFHTLSEVQQSQILCRDIRFQGFLRENAQKLIGSEALLAELPPADRDQKTYAEAVVRLYCQIESRAKFSEPTVEGEQARQRWRALLGFFEADKYLR